MKKVDLIKEDEQLQLLEKSLDSGQGSIYLLN